MKSPETVDSILFLFSPPWKKKLALSFTVISVNKNKCFSYCIFSDQFMYYNPTT